MRVHTPSRRHARESGTSQWSRRGGQQRTRGGSGAHVAAAGIKYARPHLAVTFNRTLSHASGCVRPTRADAVSAFGGGGGGRRGCCHRATWLTLRAPGTQGTNLACQVIVDDKRKENFSLPYHHTSDSSPSAPPPSASLPTHRHNTSLLRFKKHEARRPRLALRRGRDRRPLAAAAVGVAHIRCPRLAWRGRALRRAVPAAGCSPERDAAGWSPRREAWQRFAGPRNWLLLRH